MSTVAYQGPTGQTAYVLCADCGAWIPCAAPPLTPCRNPHRAERCESLRQLSAQLVRARLLPWALLTAGRIDITEGIPKQAAVNWCKGCSRYLAPPTQWVICDMESRELLAICLRKLKGLSKVRLIDAGFIWTEPHSKRLRVKLTIQKEVRSVCISQRC